MNDQSPYARAGQSMTAIFALIAVNIVFYLYFNIVNPGVLTDPDSAYYALALTREGVLNGEVWRLITYSFLHGGFAHILFNMWGLYLFGTFLAPSFKPAQVVVLYAASAVVGGLLQIAFSTAPGVGASGAVCGFTAAGAMLMPNVRLQMLFFPAPFKVKTFFWVFLAMEIILNMNEGDGIAHMAHVGGIVGGYLYTRFRIRPIAWDPFGSLFKRRNPYPDFSRNPFEQAPPREPVNDPEQDYVSPRELDRLIDKISRSGINSLTDEEYSRLRRARDSFKKR